MRIILFTDTHLREKEPYCTATKNALNEVLGVLQAGDLLVCLGDFFDKSTLTGKLAAIALTFWQQVKASTGRLGICLTGNHDVSLRYGNALRMFEDEQSACVIDEPTIVDAGGGVRLGMLPYLYGRQMQDSYPTILQGWNSDDLTAVLGHFSADPLFGEEVDVQGFTACPLWLGHIHTTDTQRYVGPLTPTRFSEREIMPRLLIFNTEAQSVTDHQLQSYLHYEELRYGDEPRHPETGVFTIVGAPSARAARERYPNLVIREVQTLDMPREVVEVDVKTVSLPELVEEFAQTITAPGVEEKFRKVMGRTS